MRSVVALLWSIIMLAAAGCATGGVMASLSDEELPVEPSAMPYPTAIEPSVAERTIEQRADETPANEIASYPLPLKAAAPPLPLKRPAPLPIEMPHEVAPPAATTAASATQAQAANPLTSESATDAQLPPLVTAAEMKAAQSSDKAVSPVENLPSIEPKPSIAANSEAAVNTAEPASSIATSVAPAAGEVSMSPVVSSPDERLSAIVRQRDVLIAMLEEDLHHRRAASGGATDPELPRLEQQLRLLYAAADRPDDAARAIDSLAETQRESYKHLMFGLSTWLTQEQTERGALRSARVLRSLRDAAGELAPAAKLDLSNLTFCERVENFGWYTEFARNDFVPKQQVILYVEVENFTSAEKGPRAFETELQGSYQIFDARGSIVAERKLPLDREVCRNARRDYFLAYPVYIPDAIEPGRYRLELSIEDLKAGGEYQGRKFGQGSLEFTVRR